MSTSVGNSNVYLFLAKFENKQDGNKKADSWQLYADRNKDGVISQKEFQNFINEEYFNMMDENLSNKDFNIFWSSVDIDTLDFKNKGRKVEGAYNLNINEIDNMNREIEDFMSLDKVCTIAEGHVKGLFGTNDDLKQWRSIVVGELTRLFEAWRADGRKDGSFDTYMTTTNLKELYEIEANATATVQKDNVVEEFMKGGNWQQLKELGYSLGEDERIDKEITRIVSEYVKNNNITSVDELKGKLSEIFNLIKPAITNYLEKTLGLNEKGEPVKNDGQVTGTKTSLTSEQKLAFKAQLLNVLDEVIAGLIGDDKNHAHLYQEYGVKYIDEELLGKTSSTYDAYKELVDSIDSQTLREKLVKYNPLTEAIKEYQEWSKLMDNLKGFLNDFENTFLNEIQNEKLKNIVKESGILTDIKKQIEENPKEFFISKADEEFEDYAKEYTRNEIAKYLNNYVEGGYKLDDSNYLGTDGKLLRTNKEADLYSIYSAGINYADKLAESSEKLNTYASFAAGYLLDVASMGENCKALVNEKVGGLNITAQTLKNQFKTAEKINEVVKNVRTDLPERIRLDEEAEINPNDPPETNIANVDDILSALGEGPYSLDVNEFIYPEFCGWDSYSLSNLYNNDVMIELVKDYDPSPEINDYISQIRTNLSTITGSIITQLVKAGLDQSILNKIKAPVVNSFISNMSKEWDAEMDKNVSNDKSFEYVRGLIVTEATKENNRSKVVSAINWDGCNQNDCIFAVSVKGLVDALIEAYNAELNKQAINIK